MKNRTFIETLITRLGAAEDAFLNAQFLAPVAGQGCVQVRIASVICRMKLRPSNFTGWGVFRPVSFTVAELARPARLSERRTYLDLFPAVRLILLEPLHRGHAAAPASMNDTRVALEGDALVHGVEDAELFDSIVARFDGSQFWFDQVDPNAEPATSAYLRESILRVLDPRLLDRPGLTPAQRLAYAAVHAQRLRRQEQIARATGEGRLRLAVEHAGAKLHGFAELHDVYRVTYTVDGSRHTSVVRKDNLSVQSAGICLSGHDAKFDLASLVGVLRRGQQAGGIRHGLEV